MRSISTECCEYTAGSRTSNRCGQQFWKRPSVVLVVFDVEIIEHDGRLVTVSWGSQVAAPWPLPQTKFQAKFIKDSTQSNSKRFEHKGNVQFSSISLSSMSDPLLSPSSFLVLPMFFGNPSSSQSFLNLSSIGEGTLDGVCQGLARVERVPAWRGAVGSFGVSSMSVFTFGGVIPCCTILMIS